MSTENSPKISKKFICDNCNYECSKKGDWNKHLLTSKHKKSTESTNNSKITHQNHQQFKCDNCVKVYKERTGLWRHKKSCNNINVHTVEITTDASHNVIMELLKQNSEFKDLIVEQNKQIIEQNKQLIDLTGKCGSNNNNNNSFNKTFNLQFFLNEQCKDALNIGDFVEQIKLQLSDLDMIGKVGYTEGMTKIIVRNLKELDVFKRPIHCSDLKREVLYVKDKDAWEKENGENIKIKNAIKVIEHKNVKQLPEWKEHNPDSDDYDSKKHMEYHNIIIESMGGATNEDENKKHEKIIRNIAKEVVIDKNPV